MGGGQERTLAGGRAVRLRKRARTHNVRGTRASHAGHAMEQSWGEHVGIVLALGPVIHRKIL